MSVLLICPDLDLQQDLVFLKTQCNLQLIVGKLFSLGQAAMLINETMPDLLVAKIKEEENIQTFKNQKVGILGMAFKPNNDDSRESLAFKLKKILTYEGAKVMCTDVYIKNSSFYLVENLIEECNIIFLGCPHDEYI